MAFYYVKLNDKSEIVSGVTLLHEVNSIIAKKDRIYAVPQGIYDAYMNNQDIYLFTMDTATGRVEQQVKMDAVKDRLKDLIGVLTQQAIFKGFVSNKRKFKCDLVTQQNITRYFTLRDLLGTPTNPATSIKLKDSSGNIVSMDKGDLKLLFRDMNKHIDKCLSDAWADKEKVDGLSTKKEADDFRAHVMEKYGSSTL
jgi:hypothetical protein